MPAQPFSLDSFQTFGDLLKYLRRRERLTQLELSIAVGYSDAQITRLEKNQRRPDLSMLKALFIPALHLEKEPEIAARLIELAQSARLEDAPAPGFAPYKGLLFFDASDAELFFGREALTTRLADRVTDLALDASRRFLAIVGASGSGKSSLMRAGLAVALKRAGWHVRVFTPTANPLKVLNEHLNAPDENPNAERILILVDQFEETFTLCHHESERLGFIKKLLSLAQDTSAKRTLVIALRADFYSHCAQYPALREAVSAEQEYIGQMTSDELRNAIEEPARRGGWEFESGLVDVLLQDIGVQGTGEPEPGALPLLSHALLATWEHRHGRMLTLEGYRASGGVRGAIAETAESVFADQLDQKQQALAQDVFLRLTELGEGTEDTRRRAPLNELVHQSAQATQLRAILNTLAEARLITLNEDSAEVAHEALIREWRRLHEWLTADREGLLLHRHLTESAQEWEARGRDPSELYRGARLAQAREWASATEERLNASERAFLTASIDHEQRDALEREAQRQRELEAAQKLAEHQALAARQLRRRALYLVGALALTVIAALTAGIFAKRNAMNLTHSEAQRLALEANSLLLNHGDPNLIALLTIQSLRMEYTQTGDAVLGSLTSLEVPLREFKGHTDGVRDVDFSPDGKYLATASGDRTAQLWEVTSGQTIQVFSGHTADLYDVDFSPDGEYLLTASRDGTARLWEVASGQTIKVFSGHTAGLDSVAFSPDGKTIATTSLGPDLTARIWDVATGKTLQVLRGHTEDLTRVFFSPDGKYVLTGSGDGTARLWDVATGREVRAFSPANFAGGVDYSLDGKYVGIVGDDGVARLFDAATGQTVREFFGAKSTIAIKFSPDSRFLLTTGEENNVLLWEIATGKILRIFGGHKDIVQDVKFSPDGNLVVTASEDKTLKLWNLQTIPGGVQFTGHEGPVYQASFSPDGNKMVTAGEDEIARIWDTATGQTLITLRGHPMRVRGAVFSPDGQQVLTTSEDTTARLWDVATGQELRRFEGHTKTVYRAAFSPDGKLLVTTGWEDGTARVWDVQTAQTIVIYTAQSSANVNRVAFSPDGKTVITSGDDSTAHIWDPLTGKDVMVFQEHTDGVTGVAYSPDGKFVVTASYDGSVRLWDVATGKEVRRFAGHPGLVFGTAFSPDGKYVSSSGADGTARLWEIQTGKEVRRFTGHNGEVRDVAFSPDGKYILTASLDGTARLWFTDYHDAIHAVCALLTRDLTPEERIQFDISEEGPTCPAQ